MNTAVSTIERGELKRLICSSEHITLSEYETQTLDACLLISNEIWVGSVEGQIACMWGLIPPSMMSTTAYLWLYTTPLVDKHKFMFVRQSQRWMERTLAEYDTIVGFCKPDNKRAIRWIEWLGGEFLHDGKRMNFKIRNRHG